MISKKEAVTLGMLAIGGVGAAMIVGGAGGDDTGTKMGPLRGVEGRAGGILGTPTYGAPGAVYNIPAAAAVTFPEAPMFDIGAFLAVPVKKDPVAEYYSTFKGTVAPREWEVRKILARRTIGEPSPATSIQPYVYTGGEVKLGAATMVAGTEPKKGEIKYFPAAKAPAAIGMATAFNYIKSRGAAGVSAPPKKEPVG